MLANEDKAAALRREMVAQIRMLGVRDERVLLAMGRVPRHRFVPEEHANLAGSYGDHPWPIGHGQTISQPYIVAYMCEQLQLKGGEKVLEIGTGCGYQAAVLAELGARVYSLEVVGELARQARQILDELGYSAVQTRLASGFDGWPDEQPFAAIVGACAPASLPVALGEQLAGGGRMILPVGEVWQYLQVYEKRAGVLHSRRDLAVRFVPMV